MKKYCDKEIDLLNIQIGCVLRLARLKQGISQYQLSLEINTDPTNIGRVERFENKSAWDKIYTISQYFNLDFCKLFSLMEEHELLSIIQDCYKFEHKLNQKKILYYENLKLEIKHRYLNL